MTATRIMLAGLVVAFILLSAAVTLAHGPWLLDAPLLHGAQVIRTDQLSRAVASVTDLGGALVMSLAGVVAAIAVALKRRRTALFLAAALAGSALTNTALKALFHRHRPSLVTALVADPGGTSFPSGHSQAAMAFAVTLMLVAWRFGRRDRKLAALLLFPLLIGASRVYLGVHYPSDVMGGWLVGAAVVLVAHALTAERASTPSEPTAPDRRANA